jgi:hypothetical protein
VPKAIDAWSYTPIYHHGVGLNERKEKVCLFKCTIMLDWLHRNYGSLSESWEPLLIDARARTHTRTHTHTHTHTSTHAQYGVFHSRETEWKSRFIYLVAVYLLACPLLQLVKRIAQNSDWLVRYSFQNVPLSRESSSVPYSTVLLAVLIVLKLLLNSSYFTKTHCSCRLHKNPPLVSPSDIQWISESLY